MVLSGVSYEGHKMAKKGLKLFFYLKIKKLAYQVFKSC